MEERDTDMVTLENKQAAEMEIHSLFKKANPPITLKFQDVYFKIKCKNKKMEEKMILKGINGIIYPGEMLALMGPSGSGKTTLLTALAGRLSGQLTGNITYNGRPFSNHMKRTLGFVTQDDVLLPNLTVNETLIFTALLRLPNTLTNKEKIHHAESIISKLNLTKCKNHIIGSEIQRGISGGERKRVSIGQELLINPSLLFLDEPTSGLDSTTAQRIMSSLSEIANGRRTVVMTIHQPSTRLFYMFHKILLLSEGNQVYFGEGTESIDYFSRIGYSASVLMNPSDFLLDLANGIFSDDSNEEKELVKQKLVTSFKNSDLAEKLRCEVGEMNDQYSLEDASELGQKIELWSTTWWQQFCVLSRRCVKDRKSSKFSGIGLVLNLGIALVSGLLWLHSHTTQQTAILYFMIVYWGFQSLYEAVFTFPEQGKILARERASGMYRLSSYFISTIISELHLHLLLPSLFMIIIYWMAGLNPNAGDFFRSLAVLLLHSLTAQGIGLALGAITMDHKSAADYGMVIMSSFVLVGGFFVERIPAFVAWFKFCSIHFYSFKLLLASQYGNSDTYPCARRGGFCKLAAVHGGSAVSVLALVAMLVGYRLVAYVALMRVGVTKKK